MANEPGAQVSLAEANLRNEARFGPIMQIIGGLIFAAILCAVVWTAVQLTP